MSNNTPTTPPVWIDTPDGLTQLINHLADETVVAVDTESDSLYSYFEKVCLIQITASGVDYLVDPLNVSVTGLAPFFASTTIQKIFHAVEYDVICLKRDYGFTLNNLFDTQTAARILGWSSHGLAGILQDQFGVTLNKRFQKYNWGERPIKPKALEYARLDTHYLLQLREIQLADLKKQGRLQEAQDAFERSMTVEPAAKVFNPDDFWRLKGVRDLHPQQQAIVRNLFILRDRIARQVDRPLFKVMENRLLLHLAAHQPHDLSELCKTKSLSEKICHKYGHDILQAIKTGREAKPPSRPRYKNQRPSAAVTQRYEALRQWRNRVAADRNTEPDIIVDNNSLMNIARRNPRTLKTLAKSGTLTEWQLDRYGSDLLAVINSH